MKLSFTTGKSGDWRIVVADNGKGFDPDKEYENHYGLEHMRLRARDSSIDLRIVSGNSGTEITLNGKS